MRHIAKNERVIDELILLDLKQVIPSLFCTFVFGFAQGSIFILVIFCKVGWYYNL